MSEAGSAFSRAATSVVFIPAGPIMLPLPVLPLWPFQLSTPLTRDLSMAERIARVAAVRVTPHKLVGYVGDSVTFVAMGTDTLGEPAHGAKFTWESSDSNKLIIDEAGPASLLRPGLVRVTAHAGAPQQTAPVLIRPTRRPLQTDEEWRADQDSFVGSTVDQPSDKSVLGALMDRVVANAYAQSGGQGADYGNAASVGQVGTPPFTALEDTRLGPVMPQSNFELPIPLVSLGGRGLATSLMAYYNSNVWGAYFDPIRNGTVYVFDPLGDVARRVGIVIAMLLIDRLTGRTLLVFETTLTQPFLVFRFLFPGGSISTWLGCAFFPELCGGRHGELLNTGFEGYEPLVGGGECGCEGTTDCGFYKKMCKEAAGKTNAAFTYYCVAAPAVCRLTKFFGDKCTMDCIRLALHLTWKQAA